MEDKPLRLLARFMIQEEMFNKKVSDYWQSGVGWNWSSFDFLLSASTLLKLTAITVADRGEMEDRLLWGDESNETFTNSRAYKRLCKSSNEKKWPG